MTKSLKDRSDKIVEIYEHYLTKKELEFLKDDSLDSGVLSDLLTKEGLFKHIENFIEEISDYDDFILTVTTRNVARKAKAYLIMLAIVRHKFITDLGFSYKDMSHYKRGKK